MSTRHGRDTAVLSLSAVPPKAALIDSRRDRASYQRSVRLPASSAAECDEGFMDLGAPVVARPSSRWRWCSQPKVRSTTQGAPRSEPCSVWRRAICGAVSDKRVDPADAKPTPSPCPSSQRLRPSRIFHKQRVASRPLAECRSHSASWTVGAARSRSGNHLGTAELWMTVSTKRPLRPPVSDCFTPRSELSDPGARSAGSDWSTV
jgi:hypothetical protein